MGRILLANQTRSHMKPVGARDKAPSHVTLFSVQVHHASLQRTGFRHASYAYLSVEEAYKLSVTIIQSHLVFTRYNGGRSK